MLYSGSRLPAMHFVKHFNGSPLNKHPAAVKRTGQRMNTNALFSKNKKKSYYDETAKQVDPLQPAFTRRREAFVGRLAMVGFASALIGELTTGRGPLGQLQLELGLPPLGADLLVFGTIAYSLIGGLRPGSPTFSESNQRDVKKRGKGPTQDARINVVDQPKKFLGITRFGFSKQNEVFVGRTAQLGFLAAVIGEKVTGGRGILSQVGLETGIPIGQQSIFLLAFIGFFLFAALIEGNYGDPEDDSTY
jgi:photosystem II protein